MPAMTSDVCVERLKEEASDVRSHVRGTKKNVSLKALISVTLSLNVPLLHVTTLI